MKRAKRILFGAGLFCLLCLSVFFASCGDVPTETTAKAAETEAHSSTATPAETTGLAIEVTENGITEPATDAETEGTASLEATVMTETTVMTEVTEETTAVFVTEISNTLDFVLTATLPYEVEYAFDDARYDDEETVLRQGQDGTVYEIFSVSPLGEREFLTVAETPPVSAVICRGTMPAYESSELTMRGDTVPFGVRYTYDDTLPEGERYTLSLGKEGYTEVLILVTYYHGEEYSRGVMREKAILPQDEVIVIGTKKEKESFGMPYIDAAHGGIDYAVTQYFGGSNSHGGIDFGVWYGEKIVSVLSGTVVAAFDDGDFPKSDLRWTYGTYVIVEHENGMRSTYAHMKDRTVTVGDRVEKGQVLGHSGNTGRVSPSPTASDLLAGTHLHFELRILENGIYQKTDPTWYLPRWDQ